MVRTGVRGDRVGDAVAGGATGAAARGDRGAAAACSVAVRAPSTGASTARSARATIPRRSSSRRRRSSWAARATACSGWWRTWPTAGTRAGCGRPTPTASASTRSTARATRRTVIPASVQRSLGLYSLCGEDERDLEARFGRLRATSPPGVLDGTTLDEWRQGRLVGTVEQVREQAAGWDALGVETLIVGVGSVPFAVTARRRRGNAGRGPRGVAVTPNGGILVRSPRKGPHEPRRYRAPHHPGRRPPAVRQHATPEARQVPRAGQQGVQEGRRREAEDAKDDGETKSA